MMMNFFLKFWQDEAGYVLSAEAVLVGTVVVAGATVGLKTVSKAVNEEFLDVATSIRSLDQSYCFEETNGCGAWTAGSSFEQVPVELSIAELHQFAEEAELQEAEELEQLEKELKEGKHKTKIKRHKRHSHKSKKKHAPRNKRSKKRTEHRLELGVSPEDLQEQEDPKGKGVSPLREGEEGLETDLF